MGNPSLQNVHYDRPLTNIAVAFAQSSNGFVADKVFPIIGVEKASDLYYTFPKELLLTNTAKRRAPGTRIEHVGWTQSTDSYNTQQYADGAMIPIEVINNSDLAVTEQLTTQKLMSSLMIQRDQSFVTSYMSTGVWTNETSSVNWSDAGSNPENDISQAQATILKGTGKKPKVLVVGYEVHLALKQHPMLIDRIKFTNGDRALDMGGDEEVQKRMIAKYFGLDQYIVAEAITNTAADGAAFSGSFIVGKNALLCYRPATPGLLEASAGYIFSWNGAPGQFGISMRSRYDEDYQANKYEAVMNYDMKKVSGDLGYFFNSVVD